MRILKRFTSKKNCVFLLEDRDQTAVYKCFNDPGHYEKEYNYYKMLRQTDLPVPKLLAHNHDHHTMLLEYLGDQTALDELESYEQNHCTTEALTLLISIFNWLDKFHALPTIKENQLAFSDLSIRNFIRKDHVLYGIDFESIEKGNFARDVGNLIAMYLNYDVKYSPFKIQVSSQLKQYILSNSPLSLCAIDSAIHSSTKAIHARRNRSCDNH
jgi:serine/threonine-protein kinase RIO1